MIKKIKVKPDKLGADIFFFREIDLTALPNPRIVPLFGPNGVGKSTLIKGIQQYFEAVKYLQRKNENNVDTILDALNPDYKFVDHFDDIGLALEYDKEKFSLYSYRNSEDNFRDRKARSINESFNPVFFAAKMNARSVSEGQSVVYSAFDLLDGLKPGKDMFGDMDSALLVLLDELDSGMSIDNIDIAMRKLKKAVTTRDKIQVFLSFNSPRVLKHFPYVISMYDGKVKEMHTDEDMMTEIRANSKMFDKARKTSKGRPKIFD